MRGALAPFNCRGAGPISRFHRLGPVHHACSPDAASALAAISLLLPQGAGAQDRVVPPSAEALRMSYAPIVKRVVPAVVTVSAAKTMANRNPLMEDPFFRRFFGPQFGGPREQTQQSLGSGVIVDPSGLIVTNNHVIDGADQVKISLADKREFAVDVVLKDPRADLAVLRVKDDSKERFPVIDVRQFRRPAGRRRGAGGRQSVRRRPDRDPRHRLGGGADAGRHLGLSVLHPDRRRDQSRQLRRRAGRHGRAPGRHQHRDLLALRRLAGHRFRHSRHHGAGRGGLGALRRQRGQAALARRQAAGADAGTVAGVQPAAAGGRGHHQRHRQRARRRGRG